MNNDMREGVKIVPLNSPEILHFLGLKLLFEAIAWKKFSFFKKIFYDLKS